jgi:signal peptidase I
MNKFKKIWHFLWHEDSVMSWIVSIILAFLIVKFVIYPLIGIFLGTGFPIVAVVSESMEHRATPLCVDYKDGACINESETAFKICGQTVDNGGFFTHNMYWETCGEWYEDNNISKKNFTEFSFKNGFNKGDIMVLVGSESKDINMGDVVVFDGDLNYPIIHRVVNKWVKSDSYYLMTKGDNNEGSSSNELEISEDELIGKAVFRLPLLGWVKIMFNSLIENLLGVFK